MTDRDLDVHPATGTGIDQSDRLIAGMPFDAVSLLTVCIVLIFIVPAGFVVGFLGAAGRPSMLVGLLGIAWWVHERFARSGTAAKGPQPVRRFTLLLLGCIFVTDLIAYSRPLVDIERSGADRGIVLILCLTGLTLLATDGISSLERLKVLLERLTTAGALLGAVGILQFFTSLDLAGILRFPGLTELNAVQGIQERSDLNRVAATASHPIEFGVVLALILPFALHFALHATKHKRWAWTRVGLIAAAIPMSVARSGTLALFVAFLVMWLSWPKPLRARALFTAIVGTVGMRLLIPGLLGTIRALFTNIMYDPSTQGRTEDYGKVGTFIGERPFFGRGFLTFVPERYFVLDNQYLGLLIETGFVGLVAFVLFFAVGIRSAWRAKIGGTPEVRSLGQAHVASLLALLISAGTFDVLAFTMVSGVVFLLVGTSGALWRLTEPERDAAQQVRQTQHVEADLDADFDAYVALATQEREPEPFDVTRLDRSTLATMINRLPRVEPRSTSSTPSDRNDE